MPIHLFPYVYTEEDLVLILELCVSLHLESSLECGSTPCPFLNRLSLLSWILQILIALKGNIM